VEVITDNEEDRDQLDLYPETTQVNISKYKSSVRSVMLYGNETWAVKEEDIHRFKRTEMKMMRWRSNATL